MRTPMTVVVGLLLLLAGTGLRGAAEQDLKGSKDHSLLTRMPSFHITGYTDSEFASHRFPGPDRKPIEVEGHKYTLEYRLDRGAPEPGELKIRRNIQEALKRIGGKVVFDENFNKVSTIMVAKGNKETWVEVRSYDNLYRLWIVEREAMKQEVVADAKAMGGDLDTAGHVAVYGIYFDTGKSEVKPESEPALSEIAKLLAAKVALKLNVVGHTDNAGTFESNLKLSKDRAEAVVKALSGRYGVAAARLRAHGVASLAPVASNDTEDGKAKNRRVELVKP